MADAPAGNPIPASDPDFAPQIDEILQEVANVLVRKELASTFFKRLWSDWSAQQAPKSAKQWATDLSLKRGQTDIAISRAAGAIRKALDMCCADKTISVTLPSNIYALHAVCKFLPKSRKLKLPEHVVGVLAADLNDWIVSPILAGLEQALARKGFQLLVRDAHDNALAEAKCLDQLSACTQGIIAIPVWDGDPHGAYARVLRSGLPLVCVDRSIQSLDQLAFVTSDNVDGGYKATKYLIETHNCQHIHVISDYPVSSSRQRIQGFLKAVERAKRVEGQVWSAQGRQGNAAAFQWAFHETLRLIKDGTLIAGSGIFALNDNLAAGCRSALEASKVKVPVIGFDGQRWGAYLSPPLETIFQDMHAMATKAASFLLLSIAGSPDIRKFCTPVELRTAKERLAERAP